MEQLNPYQSPHETSTSTAKTRRFSTNPLVWFCVGYYVLAILAGIQSAVGSEQSTGQVLMQVALALCLGLWAVADARQRGKPIPRSQQLWFLVLAGLVVPGYVIVTRGWKGAGWVVLHAVAWYALATLTMHITGYLYFGDEWWAAMGFTE